LVTQQTILFNDTVRNNIAYGSLDRSDQEIIQAAKAANATISSRNSLRGMRPSLESKGLNFPVENASVFRLPERS